MSSAISTDPRSTDGRSAKASAERKAEPDPGLQPWQFFVLAGLGCATAVTFVARGQGMTSVILLGILMATAAVVGMAALRAVRPLVSPQDDRTVLVGHRTRAALEREKLLALRAIKELEFDRAMGKLSERDWQEMSSRLRVRAARLIRQLDSGGGYREQIERDLAVRLSGDPNLAQPAHAATDTRGAKASVDREDGRTAKASAARPCASCSTINDADARFCKECGAKL
jgi:hypothetical protein